MSAQPKLKCPACSSSRTSKIFNAAGVQFKGSGFYVTDSRPGSGKAGETDKADKPEKPDVQPVAKPEASPAGTVKPAATDKE